MEFIERTAATVMVVAAALWAGAILFYAVERVNLWARMPIDQFVVDFRRSLYRADPLQPILAIIAIAGAITFALNAAGLGSAFAWTGAGLTLVVIIVSIAIPERINAQFRQRDEGVAPPEVENLRRRWRTIHYVRTVIAVAALLFLAVAATFTTA